MVDRNEKLQSQVWKLEKAVELKENQICVLESEINHLRNVHSLELQKTSKQMQILQSDQTEKAKQCKYYEEKLAQDEREKTRLAQENETLAKQVQK